MGSECINDHETDDQESVSLKRIRVLFYSGVGVYLMSDAGKRMQFIDAIKGVAIIVVIIYHLVAPCGFKSVTDHLVELSLTLFFFYSGYFYRPGKRSISESIKNKAKSLMVPFFRYSLSFWVVGSIYLIVTKNETLKEAGLCLRNFLAGCIWNRVIQNGFGWEYYSLGKRYFYLADFWFLIAMLLSSILFFLMADWALKSDIKVIVTVLALFAATGICQSFSVSLPYNFQLAPYWAAFMLLGAYAGQKDLTVFPTLSQGATCILAVLLFAVGIVIVMLKEPSVNMFRGSFGQNEVLSMILCIASAVPFVWGIGILFAQIEKAGVRLNEIAWLGSHSLFLYLFHMFYAWIISVITGFSVRYEEPVSSGVLAGSIILTAASLCLCILRGYLDDRLVKKR